MSLSPDILSELVSTFERGCHTWESALAGFASKLFWILAGIEFTWTAIQLSLRKAEEEAWLAAIVGRVLYIGFFWALLTHSSEWCQAIISSFRQAGAQAGGLQAINPSHIIGIGIHSTYETWTAAFQEILSLTSMVKAIGAVLVSLGIIVCFGLMAAMLVEALIESYIVVSAGIIFMGFGGSSWTSDYAKNMLRYAVSSGAKLFVLELILGLSIEILEQTVIPAVTSGPEGLGELYTLALLLGVGVCMCVITWSIPNKVQALVNNASFSHGYAVQSVATSVVNSLIQDIRNQGVRGEDKGTTSKEQPDAARKRDTAQRTRAILDSMPNYKRTSTPS